jgi:hypothetical protein
VQGFPEIVKAENFVIDHNLGDVISQSFGATENTFPSRDSLLDLRGSFKNALHPTSPCSAARATRAPRTSGRDVAAIAG